MTDTKLSQEEMNQIATIFSHRIRHALMNDLGLSRDFVRAEAKTIVDDAVKKAVNELLDAGYIKTVVTRQIEVNASMIKEEVRRQVSQILNNKLSITLN